MRTIRATDHAEILAEFAAAAQPPKKMLEALVALVTAAKDPEDAPSCMEALVESWMKLPENDVAEMPWEMVLSAGDREAGLTGRHWNPRLRVFRH